MKKTTFIALSLVLILPSSLLAEGQDPGVSASEARILQAQPLPLTSVRLTGGPLKHSQDLDAQYLLDLKPDRMLAGYRIRAGLEPKAQAYGGWDSVEGRQLTGHVAGHYLSAVSLMYAATGDERFKKRADYLVEEMKEVQDTRGNGYLGAIANREGTDGAEIMEQVAQGDIRSGGFDLNGMWSPWYTLHKTYAGLRDAYRFTGNKTALELEIKFAAWAEGIVSKLSDAQVQRMLNTEFGGMNEVFVDLYADTGDTRWLDLSYKFEHRSFIDPLTRHIDNLPGKHGNTQIPKLIGSADRFAYTGKAGDLLAAAFFWDCVVQHHSFATGGDGKDEYFHEPDELNAIVDGRTCETCNVYNMLKLTRRLFAIEPDAHYADFHERALFNHILASQDPNDGWACYMVPVGHAVQHEYERNMRDGGFTCCTGTSMESHALHADGIYYESNDKLWVNLYAPSTANWATEGVKLAVETDFPEGESATIKLTVDSPREFTLALRKPYWAGDGFEITVNGWPVSDDVIDPYRDVPESGRPRRDRGREMEGPSSYVELKRTWQTGDTVEIALPKSLHLEPTPDNPRVAAILWGPLVLAGDLGPEQERGGGRGNRSEPIVAPVFVAAEQPVAEWLKPVAGEPGHFRTDGVGRIPDSVDRVRDVDFVPFYRLHRRTYGIYWDLFTQSEWEQKQAQYAAEKERKRKLELATVGYAQPGEMQPERDYNYQGGEGSRPVRVEGRAGRQSRSWFSFDMPVDPAHSMGLVVTYYSAEWRRGPARFEILVDGQRIAEQEVERAEPPHFYDVQYPIGAGLVRGKEKVTVRFQAAEGSSIAAVFGIRTIRTGEAGTQTEPTAEESASDVNLAIVATPSTSYVSGDTSTAALNDESDHRSSRDRRQGAYGNWPTRDTQWVQYEWSQPISTNKIDVYWWDDRQGVRLPKACRLLYWDGDAFVPATNPSGLGVVESQYNTTTFDEIRTSKLRLEIDGNDTFSTGILEWKVYDSGQSPDFPPQVDAGVDRDVVLGGKTYLAGKTKSLAKKGSAPVKTTWSKVSGPGSVAFEDAGAQTTRATFSAVGDYVLRLTATKGSLSGSSTLNVKVVAPPPAQNLHLVDTKPYRIDSPLWNDRAKALIVNWIPHCIAKISDPNLKEGGINNFIEAANKLTGKPHGQHRGYVFANAWVYNTIESICVALMVDPQGDQEIIEAQNAMKATLEDWIPKILAAQEPDGYLQTVFTLNDWEHWSPRHRSDHEGYVAGYFLEAAVAHHNLTKGKDLRLYNAAKKLADCWDANIGPAPKKEWYDGHQAMEIALVRFGRFVNDTERQGEGDKYIKLAKFLLDCRKDGSEYDQSHVPVVQQYEAVGHAVRASYSYAGMADVAMETGDIDYQSAVMSLWDNIVNRKYYVTGGIGSGETSEGFGPDYSLRHNAYCESCSSCGEIYFQHKLNLTYHDAKFADLYEETLYNALLGSVDLEGKNFYYQNPLDSYGARYPWHGCPCCVGNIPRVLLMLPTWTYAKSDDGLYVNLFVGSSVTIEDVAGTDVEMVQKTNYPWSGNVSITVNPATAKEFSIRIRLPHHGVSELYTSAPSADGITSFSVNGTRIVPAVERGYAIITRQWKAGDKIELVLPMTVQRIKASDKIEATQGRVALRYGPLIYCVETVDQSLNNVLDPASPLNLEWNNDLLHGVATIKGTWADGSPMTAIPYYARDNRGTGAATSNGDEAAGRRRRRSLSSSVWLKDE